MWVLSDVITESRQSKGVDWVHGAWQQQKWKKSQASLIYNFSHGSHDTDMIRMNFILCRNKALMDWQRCGRFLSSRRRFCLFIHLNVELLSLWFLRNCNWKGSQSHHITSHHVGVGVAEWESYRYTFCLSVERTLYTSSNKKLWEKIDFVSLLQFFLLEYLQNRSQQ